MQKTKIGLFITRVQPGLHYGQIDGLHQAMSKGIKNFIIGIGSANKEFTKENPFTYDERKKMVEFSLEGIKGISYQIFPVPDLPTDELRKNHILKNLPAFQYVVTGNPRVRTIFQKNQETRYKNQENKKIFWLKIRKDVKGTFIRDQLALGDTGELKKSLPVSVVNYLIKIKAIHRLSEIFRNERFTPNLCVDVIVKDKQGNLLLIERKNYPYGVAIPGGFINYGEKPEDAAIREIREEIGIKIRLKGMVGVYGDPHRDPRAHNVAVVYAGEYVSGKIKAHDDANKIISLKLKAGSLKQNLKNLDKINFCFDHKKIIKNYLKIVNS